MAWQCISPEVTVRGCKKCVYPVQWMRHNDMLWNDSEEDWNIRSECEEVKALTVELETVTLIGKGR